jgi:single-strand DNA-binding protein
MNSVNIIGNLTRDPEIKHTQGGMAIVNLGIAWNGRKKQGEEWVDQPHFFNVTCFGERFEKLAAFLEKGKKIGVSGRLDFQQWEKDGVKNSKVVILANEITFASSKGEGSGDTPSEPAHDNGDFVPSNTPDDDDIPF